MSHTPGPWKIVREAGEIPCVNSDRDEPICDVYEYGSPGGRANLPLIAAAPDLLKELEHLVSLLEPVEHYALPPGLATLNAAREAIKKARYIAPLINREGVE